MTRINNVDDAMKKMLKFIFLLLCCAIYFPASATGAMADSVQRPQMTAEQASRYALATVLSASGTIGDETSDPWDPISDSSAKQSTAQPDYVVDWRVAGDGAHQFQTLQACINHIANLSADSNVAPIAQRRRQIILVMPGIYHELLYIPALPISLTLTGADPDPSKTVITADLDATVTSTEYLQRYGQQFSAAPDAITTMVQSVKNHATIGTDSTASVWIRNDGFQARNLTIENGYQLRADCLRSGCHDTLVPGEVVHHQAVALLVDGADRVQFDHVRVLGHQDTLYLKSAPHNVATRIFFNQSLIEGDVDFIFGDATAYFYQSEIKSLSDRPVSYMAAPSTNYQTRYGFVFNACQFTTDDSTSSGTQFYLARQWFHNQKCTPYHAVNVAGYSCRPGDTDGYTSPKGTISRSVLETVGKVAILNSRLGKHFDVRHLWSNWNSPGALAYRPAQFTSDAYWENLLNADIDPVTFMGYPKKRAPSEWFIAEFNNSVDE